MRVQAFFLGAAEPKTLAEGAFAHTVILGFSWVTIFLGVSVTLIGLMNEASPPDKLPPRRAGLVT